MRIYMTHPEHGAMHVYAKWQLEDNLKRGWKVTPEPWAKPAAPAPADDLTIDPPLKRRGRPPKVTDGNG
jgi:hypothetical protein